MIWYGMPYYAMRFEQNAKMLIQCFFYFKVNNFKKMFTNNMQCKKPQKGV